jgi:hypothetical protein
VTKVLYVEHNDDTDAKPIEFESLVATIGRVLAPHE